MNPYSAGYWNVPLPPAQYYPPYYYLPPPQGPPLSPGRRHVHQYVAPPRVIELNPFIDAANRGTARMALWYISSHFHSVQRLAGKGRLAPLAQTHFDQAATRPSLRRMQITIPEYNCLFDIDSGDLGFVTLGDLFRGIYSAMRADFGEADWEDLGEEEQMMIHEQRCARLTREEASYELNSVVRRIDGMFDTVLFSGLKQVGPTTDMLWELKLAKPKPPKEKRRF